MRQQQRLSGLQILLWSGLGLGAGLAVGFTLSEWIGDVNRVRVRGVARRLRQGPRARLTSSATGRAVEAALQAEARLADIPIEVMAVSRGVVELRGWVPTRAARAIAGRTALAAPGIESVINSLLVRGEDDLTRVKGSRATDQSA